MRLKHNKKRNTALVYEILVRELTESVVKNNKNKQNKIVSIIKEHFNRDSVLKEELELYRSIYETRELEKSTAEKIMLEAKSRHENIDKKTLFREQSALINKINRTLSNKVYNNFVPNYKTIASVYSIFQETLPVRDRVLLEESIVNQMSSSLGNRQEDQQPIDSIVYGTFVNKFNEEYSKNLTESQKDLLGTYVSSFSDNSLELKVYLNEEIGRLKVALRSAKEHIPLENTTFREKLDKVYGILDETKTKQIDTETLEIVLNTQQLISEIDNDS
jgi:hypothetical protein